MTQTTAANLGPLENYLLNNPVEKKKTLLHLATISPFIGMHSVAKVLTKDKLDDILSTLREHLPDYDRNDVLTMRTDEGLVFVSHMKLTDILHGIAFIASNDEALYDAPWSRRALKHSAVNPIMVELEKLDPSGIPLLDMVYPEQFRYETGELSYSRIRGSLRLDFTDDLRRIYMSTPRPYAGFEVHQRRIHDATGDESVLRIEMLMRSPHMGQFHGYWANLWNAYTHLQSVYEEKSSRESLLDQKNPLGGFVKAAKRILGLE